MKILDYKGQQLRACDWPDRPKFVVVDIKNILNCTNTTELCRHLPPSYKSFRHIERLGRGPKKYLCVTRQGFFEILKKSFKPNARELFDWLLTEVFRLPDTHRLRRNKMKALSKTLGFRLSQEKGKWTYRAKGCRRKATEPEIKLWKALKHQMEELTLAESHALDRDYAYAWIESYRSLRKHATETISRSSELSRLAEKAAERIAEHGQSWKQFGDKAKAARCRNDAKAIRGALKCHKEAAQLAKRKLGIEPRRDKAPKPGAAIIPLLELPKS